MPAGMAGSRDDERDASTLEDRASGIELEVETLSKCALPDESAILRHRRALLCTA